MLGNSVRNLILVAAAVAVSGCTHVVNEETIFRPDQENRRPITSDLAIDHEDSLPADTSLTHLRLVTDFGTIAVSHAKRKSDRLIIHCGGNRSDRKTDGVPYLNGVLPFGDVLIFDYPAYGDSEGTTAFNDFLATNKAIAKYANTLVYKERVIWGQSLGGFVCSQLATDIDNLDVIIFETTAANAASVAKAWVPWYANPFVTVEIGEGLASFDNVTALAAFKGRVLVIGAKNDEQLPVKLSQNLARNLEKQGNAVTYFEFPNASHMDVPMQPEFKTRVLEYLRPTTP